MSLWKNELDLKGEKGSCYHQYEYSEEVKHNDKSDHYLASETGVKLAAASFPKTSGYVFELERFDKLIADP